MDSLWRIIIISLIAFIVLIVLLITLTTIFKKNRLRKMHNQIEEIFNDYTKNNPNTSFEAITKAEYDYIFETPKYRYYIREDQILIIKKKQLNIQENGN